MSKLTGKPYPDPAPFGPKEILARFKAENRPDYKAPEPAPKGIVEAVKGAVAKTFKKRK